MKKTFEPGRYVIAAATGQLGLDRLIKEAKEEDAQRLASMRKLLPDIEAPSPYALFVQGKECESLEAMINAFGLGPFFFDVSLSGEHVHGLAFRLNGETAGDDAGFMYRSMDGWMVAMPSRFLFAGQLGSSGAKSLEMESAFEVCVDGQTIRFGDVVIDAGRTYHYETTLPAGRYFIGDPCYVVGENELWHFLLEQYMPNGHQGHGKMIPFSWCQIFIDVKRDPISINTKSRICFMTPSSANQVEDKSFASTPRMEAAVALPPFRSIANQATSHTWSPTKARSIMSSWFPLSARARPLSTSVFTRRRTPTLSGPRSI